MQAADCGRLPELSPGVELVEARRASSTTSPKCCGDQLHARAPTAVSYGRLAVQGAGVVLVLEHPREQGLVAREPSRTALTNSSGAASAISRSTSPSEAQRPAALVLVRPFEDVARRSIPPIRARPRCRRRRPPAVAPSRASVVARSLAQVVRVDALLAQHAGLYRSSAVELVGRVGLAESVRPPPLERLEILLADRASRPAARRRTARRRPRDRPETRRQWILAEPVARAPRSRRRIHGRAHPRPPPIALAAGR